MESNNERLKEIKELVDNNKISMQEYYILRADILGEKYEVASGINNLNSNEIKINKYYVIAIVTCFFLLSFHFVPSKLYIFPKDHFTFSNTLILESDIEKIIDRYNNANLMERQIILQNPLINQLFEKGFLEYKDE